ncbi:MAG: SCO family protein [Flavipsychrobacter sp.]|nr:SCO family protein [Flavipsychrobacter sp.]
MSKDKMPKLPKYYIAEGYDAANRDSIYHQVADIILTNQFGEHVSLNNDLKGKMVLVNFFFTNCPTVCPQISNNMEMLQDAFKKDPKKKTTLDTAIHFISISVDPERDSFPALRKYADRYKANPDHWWFLTGDRQAIYNFARKQLFVTMQEGTGGMDDFIHSEKLVLLDSNRYIRGYYNGRDTADIIRCADDIVILTRQKKKKK